MSTSLANTVIPAATGLLDQALQKLESLGLVNNKDGTAPITEVIARVSDLDEPLAVSIARTLDQASFFNSIVREQISGMDIATRHEEIASNFNSIRDDAMRMLDQLKDGEVDWKEKGQNLWMRFTRGDIPGRFAKINSTFLEVSAATDDQLRRETLILEAYSDYRSAIKAAEVSSHKLREIAVNALERAEDELARANTAVQEFPKDGSDPALKAEKELNRDQLLTAFERLEKKEQICKDLTENLTIAYSTGEVVMARLNQTSDAKERVHTQSMTFFSTNEGTFTALAAALASLQGTHEATQALEAMKDGANQNIETIAEVGDEVNLKAIEAGYGPTIAAKSVEALVDAVVNYQKESRELIQKLRAASTDNAEEVQQVVENGKQRILSLKNHIEHV